jgi:hypothetical protein
MNNKIIGLIIAVLYFTNYKVCEFIYPDGGIEWFKLKVVIYCLIILLSIEYKRQNLFIEKIFLAVIFNNIYVLLYKNETGYTLNDIYFISFFTLIQYVKQLFRICDNRYIRYIADYFDIEKKKEKK